MSRIRADKFVNRAASGAPELTYGAQVVTGYGITGAGGINITGVATANSFSGNWSGALSVTDTTASSSTSTGALIVSGGAGIAKSVYVGGNLDVTGAVSVGGTLTYEDVTNVDSVGVITARDDIKIVTDSKKLIVGAGGDLEVYHDGTHSYITNTTGDLKITDTSAMILATNALRLRNGAGDEEMIVADNGDGVDLYFNNSKKFETTNTGVTVTGTAVLPQNSVADAVISVGATCGITTITTSKVLIGTGVTINNSNIVFNQTLMEKTNTAGGTLGSNSAMNTDQGMVYRCNGSESGSLTFNVRHNGSTALSSILGVGETITVTVILEPNNSGVIATMQIDGTAQTVQKNGGSWSAGSDGYDVYTFVIMRTGTGTTDYLVIGSLTNHT